MDSFFGWWIIACIVIFGIPFIIKKIKINRKNKLFFSQNSAFQDLKIKANEIHTEDELIKKILNGQILKYIDDVENNRIFADESNITERLKILNHIIETEALKRNNSINKIIREDEKVQHIDNEKSYLIDPLNGISDIISFPEKCDYYNQITGASFYWLSPMEAERSGMAIFRALNQFYWLPDEIKCVCKDIIFETDEFDSNLFLHVCAYDNDNNYKFEFITKEFYPKGDIYFSYIPGKDRNLFARYAIIDPTNNVSNIIVENISNNSSKIKLSEKETKLLSKFSNKIRE